MDVLSTIGEIRSKSAHCKQKEPQLSPGLLIESLKI